MKFADNKTEERALIVSWIEFMIMIMENNH